MNRSHCELSAYSRGSELLPGVQAESLFSRAAPRVLQNAEIVGRQILQAETKSRHLPRRNRLHETTPGPLSVLNLEVLLGSDWPSNQTTRDATSIKTLTFRRYPPIKR
jgi:hypothetical protein